MKGTASFRPPPQAGDSALQPPAQTACETWPPSGDTTNWQYAGPGWSGSILVILLGRVERASGATSVTIGRVEQPLRVQLRDLLPRRPASARASGRRSPSGTACRRRAPWRFERRRVVDGEEDVEELRERDDFGSKVTWTTSAWPVSPAQTSLVGRVRPSPAGVARNDLSRRPRNPRRPPPGTRSSRRRGSPLRTAGRASVRTSDHSNGVTADSSAKWRDRTAPLVMRVVARNPPAIGSLPGTISSTLASKPFSIVSRRGDARAVRTRLPMAADLGQCAAYRPCALR